MRQRGQGKAVFGLEFDKNLPQLCEWRTSPDRVRSSTEPLFASFTFSPRDQFHFWKPPLPKQSWKWNYLVFDFFHSDCFVCLFYWFHAQNLNRKENPALSYSDVELQVCSVLLFGGQYRRRDIAKALPGSLTRLIHPLPTLSLSRWSQTQNVKYRPRLTHDRKYTGNTEMWRQIRSNFQFYKDSTLTSNEAAKHIIRQETIWKSFYSISYILD